MENITGCITAINLYSNSIQKFYEKGAISNIIKYIPRETKRSKKDYLS